MGGARGRVRVSFPEPARPAPAAPELAIEAVDELDRQAAALRDAVERVRGAHAANDVERWGEARGRLDGMLREVARARERARGAAAEGTVAEGTATAGAGEITGRLAAAEAEIEALVAEAGALVRPPSGIVRLACEDELADVLAAPIEGSVAAGYQRKEAALRVLLDRLSVAESRVLAGRLRRARPDDALASLFGRMTADRRGRLLAYLDDARRREAIRASRAPRGAPTTAAASR